MSSEQKEPTAPLNTRVSAKHPPGPKGVPLLGSLFQARKDPLQFTLDLTRQYGDITRFRIGTYSGYLLNHPDYFQHVLKYNHRNYNKDNYNFRKLKPVLGEGLITADGAQWAQDHRLIQPAFHRKRIPGLTPTVTDATKEMLEHWEVVASQQRPVSVRNEMMKLTLAIITRSLFGTDIRSSASSISKAFSTLNEDISYRFKTVFIPPHWIPTPRNRRFKQALHALNQQVYTIIGQRRNSAASQDDLLEMLLSAQDEESGSGMTDQQVRDEVMTLLLAGHETTANLLAWTCYLLSQHPEAERKVRGELRQAIGNRAPEGADLPNLPYLRMVIQESLRMYPPVWIISRKAIARDVIGGYVIPAGSTVTLCSYALHRHPVYWDEPEVFRPERFSDKDGEPAPPAYFPFGAGPRSCIGGHFAMMEAQLVLAMIYSRYHLHLVSGPTVAPEPLVTLRPGNRLNMELEPT